MMAADIRLQIKARNARVLRAIERAGFANVTQFCAAMGRRSHQSMIAALINLKRRPVRLNGSWTKTAMDIATFLHVHPEALWPDYMQQIEMKRNDTEVDVSVDELAKLATARPSAEQSLINKEQVRELLEVLPERDRTIVELRYGLNGYGEHATEEIASLVGMTDVAVRAAEASAMRRMLHKRRAPAFRRIANWQPTEKL
jgi:DNA-directed RNA polymerase sigma subunit (sigma70/sigma32)